VSCNCHWHRRELRSKPLARPDCASVDAAIKEKLIDSTVKSSFVDPSSVGLVEVSPLQECHFVFTERTAQMAQWLVPCLAAAQTRTSDE